MSVTRARASSRALRAASLWDRSRVSLSTWVDLLIPLRRDQPLKAVCVAGGRTPNTVRIASRSEDLIFVTRYGKRRGTVKQGHDL